MLRDAQKTNLHIRDRFDINEKVVDVSGICAKVCVLLPIFRLFEDRIRDEFQYVHSVMGRLRFSLENA